MPWNYLPNQKPRYVRLDRARIELIREALSRYIAARMKTDPPQARHAKVILKALPTHVPYTLIVHPTEWGIISAALRPEGSSPPPGSFASKTLALYHWLAKRIVFLTEGDEKRLADAAKRIKKQGGFKPALRKSVPLPAELQAQIDKAKL